MNSSELCELVSIYNVNTEVFVMNFNWNGDAPLAGQFFMVKPLRSSVFLPRPISVCEYYHDKNTIKFLLARRGKGTNELSQMRAGEKAELTGPLGNAWEFFLPDSGKIALIGGGVGVAPLTSLITQKQNYDYHFYAGFKRGFRDKEEENALLGSALKAGRLTVAAENGMNGCNGLITDFIDETESYDAVFACGTVPLLKAIKEKYEAKNVPYYVSMENRMACGVGACLGCTIHTTNGNSRCCADGPIYPAQKVFI
jgi:NAD(P)H-flavin reductase